MPEHDLGRLLATLDAGRRKGEFVYVERPGFDAPLAAAAEAMVREDGAVSYVIRRERVAALGLPPSEATFPCAWISLRVHSALDAVGLTAAFSAALGARGIPCNVLAGARHDHLLVPTDRADEALQVLGELQARHA